MTTTPCTTDPTPVTTGSYLELAVDLTSFAQRVTLCASVRPTDPELAAVRATTLAIWEDLCGLSGETAVDMARSIAEQREHVTAAVVPF